MKEKLLTLEKFDRAKAWIEAALQDLQQTLAQHDVHVYRELTGTAAVTATPYTHAKWDVVDESVTEYRDGMIVCVKVPVAGNGTYGTALQINNLGYKPVVYNVNSMVSTRYSVGSVVWAVYNATQTASLYIDSASASTVTGCWQVQDYDSNTNTIGYQLRTNSSTRPVSSATYRYRLMFSSLDNSQWVPANNSTSTNATSARTVNQEVINPWGRIIYYGTTTARTAGQSLSTSAQWDRYILNLGYSFNDGSELALTFPGPVYIKCTPQAGGGAIIDSTTPYTQTLPSTADGKIYIYLGQAYSASEVELMDYHPVFCHDGTKIALWTDTNGFSGDYNDLTNKPTNVSSFSNDAGYVKSSSIFGIGFVASNKIIVSDDVTFTTVGGDFSTDFILICGEQVSFSGSSDNKKFYRLDGTDTGYHFNNNITIQRGVYKAVLGDTTLYLDELTDPVSGVNDGTNWTSIKIGTKTYSIPSGGITNHNFTHTANTTVSTSTTTVTFAANQRGSAMLTISADLGLTIACNNGSDNYLWVKNAGSAEVDVTISAVTKDNTAVSNVYVPSDGITVPAGGVCEIGVIVNADGAFITSRNDLSL